jgi:cation:H+ antiporter
VSFLLLVVGLVILTFGAELLVRFAVKLSMAARISPLVVGLTVVAFGTSAPEMVVSAQSAWRGQADIAIGNVVGSNICNVLLILGLSAIIRPLRVDRKLIRFDVPLMIGIGALLWLLALDRDISRRDGAVLFAGIIVFTVWSVIASRRETARAVDQEFDLEYAPKSPPTPAKVFGWVAGLVLSLALLMFGSQLFVDGAVTIARGFGVSELVIGLTLVSLGTSMPEVATSVVASWKGEGDIAVGNVVGSNVFNILSVLGVSGLVAPDGLPVAEEVLRLDLPVMMAVFVACLPIFFTGHRIKRWEGAVFLAYYVAYTMALVLLAKDSPWVTSYRFAMLGFVLPLTAITVVIAAVRYWRLETGRSPEGGV